MPDLKIAQTLKPQLPLTYMGSCRIILGTQKGTIILTTTHIRPRGPGLGQLHQPKLGFCPVTLMQTHGTNFKGLSRNWKSKCRPGRLSKDSSVAKMKASTRFLTLGSHEELENNVDSSSTKQAFEPQPPKGALFLSKTEYSDVNSWAV